MIRSRRISKRSRRILSQSQGRALNNDNEASVATLGRIFKGHESLDKPKGAGRYVGAPRS